MNFQYPRKVARVLFSLQGFKEERTKRSRDIEIENMSAHLISPFVAYNDKHRSLARLNAILHQGPYPCIHLFPHRKKYNIPAPPSSSAAHFFFYN
jgi:hypothetical protein